MLNASPAMKRMTLADSQCYYTVSYEKFYLVKVSAIYHDQIGPIEEFAFNGIVVELNLLTPV